MKQQSQVEISPASTRYLKEVAILEAFLSKCGLEATKDQLAEERTLINWLAATSSSEDEVLLKSESFQMKLVKNHVYKRFERIRDFVSCLTEVPDVVTHCHDKAIKAAYAKSCADKCWKDRFEDSLMVMAVMNWKPRTVPECKSLPRYCLQTICQIRGQFFSGKIGGERGFDVMEDLAHRYVFADFQGFLTMTALLYNAMDTHGVDLMPHKLESTPSDSGLDALTEASEREDDGNEEKTVVEDDQQQETPLVEGKLQGQAKDVDDLPQKDNPVDDEAPR